MFSGRRASAAYLLSDMAADTFGLMDHLGIDSAHVVGASMGGMIGQTMAIEQPERVRSLVSMMSTTGNRRVGQPSLKAWGVLLSKYPRVARGLRRPRAADADGAGLSRLPDRRGAVPPSWRKRSYDRGHNTAGVIRQMHAISASGDRTEALESLQVPTTVLHGTSDPLARPAGGRATAKAIPGARLRIFEGMGHDLPRELWPEFVDEITATAERGGASLTAPARTV